MFTHGRCKNAIIVQYGILISSLVLFGAAGVCCANSQWVADGKAVGAESIKTGERSHTNFDPPAPNSDPLKNENSSHVDDKGREDLFEGFDDKTQTEDEDGENELLKGFDDAFGKEAAGTDSSQSYKTRRFDLDGYIKLGSTYNFYHNRPAGSYHYPDWQGISSLRPEFNLRVNGRLSETLQLNLGVRSWYDFVYDIKGMEEFRYTEIDESSKYEVDIQDAYLYVNVNSKIDLKLGRQIVTWGKADFLSVTNIINPLDLRTFSSPYDARMPVGMARLDFYWNDLTLTGVGIFEKRFNKLPVYGDEFWPYKYGGIDDDPPEDKLENIEYALALNYRPGSFDVTLYYADLFDNMPYIEPVTADANGQINYKHITHARIKMFGAAFSFPFLDTIILKGEAAFFDGLKYISNPIIPPVGTLPQLSIGTSDKSYRRVDGLVAFEYTGIKNTVVIGEILANYNINDQALVIDKDSPSQSEANVGNDFDFGWSAGVNRSFLRNTLNVRLGAIAYQQKNFDVLLETLMVGYDLTDSIKITAALLFYNINAESDLIRDELSDNDQISVEVKYSF